MTQALTIYLTIVIMFGFTNLVVAYLVHLRYNNKISLYYLLFILLLFVDNASSIIHEYLITSMEDDLLRNVVNTIETFFNIISYSGYVIVTTVLYKTVYKNKVIRRPYLYLMIPLSLIAVILGIYELSMRTFSVEGLFSFFIYFAFAHIISGIVTGLWNIKLIKDDTLRYAVKRVLSITVILFPLVIAEIKLRSFGFNFFTVQKDIGNLIGPTLSLIVSGLAVAFSIRFVFSEIVPKHMDEKERLKEIATEYRITNREQEIIALVLEAYTNKEIADELFLSEGTVKNHIYNIYKKIDVKSRAELINCFK